MTFNRDNVTLVDVRKTPIEAITPTGLRTRDGEYPIDSLVFATGFDALTGSLNAIDIRGRGGLALRDKWAEGPRNHLGLMVRGFPNFFTVTGPGSPSVLSNVVHSIEQHVDWLAGCISYMRDQHIASIEPEQEAEDKWIEHFREVADRTLYRRLCDEIAADTYRGFELAADRTKRDGTSQRTAR